MQMSSETSLNNYEYLDILDRGWSESGVTRPAGGVLCDVGCASFWYAAACTLFFVRTGWWGLMSRGIVCFVTDDRESTMQEDTCRDSPIAISGGGL